jgi:diphosphomevalonate decarboxylase
VRASAPIGSQFARVDSKNDFPTAAGLASSASGFAALALAATRAAGLDLSPEALSSLARQSSASAARSLFGGFVALGAGERAAEAVAPADHWPVRLLVAVTESGPKAVSSSEGMQQTAQSSPYYRSWVDYAPKLYETIRGAVLRRDLPVLGEAMEQSCLMMHACMFAATPWLIYFSPATLRIIHAVKSLREDRSAAAYFTIDAGPHVKVLCLAEDAETVHTALSEIEGVKRVIRCAPGPAAKLVGP